MTQAILTVFIALGAWLFSRPRYDRPPVGAGSVIADVPDPSASYLPENRPVSPERAAELRHWVTGA